MASLRFKRVWLWGWVLAAVACGPHPLSVTNRYPLIPEALFVDADGHNIDQFTSPDTAIYKRVGAALTPIVRPDGSPMTWGVYNGATGTTTVTCTSGGDGTQLTFSMHGLVPGAVYSQWASLVAPPGVREEGSLALIGASPIGAQDGSQASIVADANGDGEISQMVPSGPTNFSANGYSGSFPSCLLDSYSFLLISFYSNTDQPLGSSLGDPNGYALDLNWFFDNGRATAP